MTTPAVIEARFIDAPSGRIFAVHHQPAQSRLVRGQVLFVPPFNEEMNRSRSMMTLQALACTRMGYGSLVVDLHGTGDSAGEFRDARWEIWQQDLIAAHAWLSRQAGGCAAVVGIRLGAILAAELIEAIRPSATKCILWQPVIDGKMHLTQFLRVRMAAQLDRPHLPKETTQSMRDQMARGECVEVAGYEIHPQLAASLDKARLLDHPPGGANPTLWLENVASESNGPAPASQKLIDTWTAQGAKVQVAMYSGPAFWQVHERVTAPDLIAQTSAWLEGPPGP